MFNFDYVTKEDINKHNPLWNINNWRFWIWKN